MVGLWAGHHADRARVGCGRLGEHAVKASALVSGWGQGQACAGGERAASAACSAEASAYVGRGTAHHRWNIEPCDRDHGNAAVVHLADAQRLACGQRQRAPGGELPASTGVIDLHHRVPCDRQLHRAAVCHDMQPAVEALDHRCVLGAAGQSVGDAHQSAIEYARPGHADATEAAPAVVLDRGEGAR